MVHLRIVAPATLTEQTLVILEGTNSAANIVVVPGAGRRPPGDVVMCDVLRADASAVIEALQTLGIPGSSIASEPLHRLPTDPVSWQDVQDRTGDSATLSFSLLAFMVIAALIAAAGIYLDALVLIVGAVIVGPVFGPIAGVCVGVVQPPRSLAGRSLFALVVSFAVAMMAVFWVSLIFKATGVTPDTFRQADHGLAAFIASTDFLFSFVAFCAGIAGALSLTTAKSGALVGVLISLLTIPQAANIGVCAAYAEWSTFRGSATQLGVNLAAIAVAATLTLAIQRVVDRQRSEQRLGDEVPDVATEEQPAGAS
jgi:uncharacterized hydrophobic protein (TIGR00271 family)